MITQIILWVAIAANVLACLLERQAFRNYREATRVYTDLSHLLRKRLEERG